MFVTSLRKTHARLREFNVAREWSRFHSPKNLTLALAGEVGELATLFQWCRQVDGVVWLGASARAK